MSFEYHHKKGCRQIKLPDGRMLRDGELVLVRNRWCVIDLNYQDQKRVFVRPSFPHNDDRGNPFSQWVYPQEIVTEAEAKFQQSLKGI